MLDTKRLALEKERHFVDREGPSFAIKTLSVNEKALSRGTAAVPLDDERPSLDALPGPLNEERPSLDAKRSSLDQKDPSLEAERPLL